MAEGSERSGDPTRRISTGEPLRLSGIVILRGNESPEQFQGTVVQWQGFLSPEELDFVNRQNQIMSQLRGREQLEQHLSTVMLSPFLVTEGQLAERIEKKVSKLPSDAVLVAYSGIDLTHFAMSNFCPFACVISPGGATAHGTQLLQDPKIFKAPPNFVAIGRVEDARALKDGDRLQVTIDGQRVKILKL